MGRTVLIVFAVIGLILVTLFGLGPVIFADGTTRERIVTLGFVLVLYILLIWLLRVLVGSKGRK